MFVLYDPDQPVSPPYYAPYVRLELNDPRKTVAFQCSPLDFWLWFDQLPRAERDEINRAHNTEHLLSVIHHAHARQPELWRMVKRQLDERFN